MLATKFSPKVRSAASKVLLVLQEGSKKFNGVHLRLEDDISDYLLGKGGLEASEKGYVDALARLGYEKLVNLYVASGIFADETNSHSKGQVGLSPNILQNKFNDMLLVEALYPVYDICDM